MPDEWSRQSSPKKTEGNSASLNITPAPPSRPFAQRQVMRPFAKRKGFLISPSFVGPDNKLS